MLEFYDCSRSRPDLFLTYGNVCWASLSDYQERRLSLDLTVINVGITDALGVYLTRAENIPSAVKACYPECPFPLDLFRMSLGDIPVGQGAGGTLLYSVPEGVSAFKTTIHASSRDSCGHEAFYFPGA